MLLLFDFYLVAQFTPPLVHPLLSVKRRDVCFKKGDKVYLKLQPYRQKSLAMRPNEKLSPRFYGPFEIEDKVGLVAYRLQLPPTARIHPDRKSVV